MAASYPSLAEHYSEPSLDPNELLVKCPFATYLVSVIGVVATNVHMVAILHDFIARL